MLGFAYKANQDRQMNVCLCVHVESTGEGSALQENEKQEKFPEQQELDGVTSAPGKAAFQECATSVIHPDNMIKYQYCQIPKLQNY